MKPKKWLKQAAFILFDKKKKQTNTHLTYEQLTGGC